jgi:sulfonate dioxygenase
VWSVRRGFSLLFTELTYSVWRKQHTFDIKSHRALGAHFGPLHKHATYAVPRRGDLDDVVGEYLCYLVGFQLIVSGLLG